MSTEQFLLSHDDAVGRNPLAVLNADPTYLPPGSRDRIFMADIPGRLKADQKKLEEVQAAIRAGREPQEDPPQPTYQRRKTLWQQMSRSESGKISTEQAGLLTVLQCYVQDFPESLWARANLDTSWQELYASLQELQRSMLALGIAVPQAPFPVEREDAARRTRVVDLPTTADVRSFLEAVQRLLPAPKKSKKKSKVPKPDAAVSGYANASATLEAIEALKNYRHILHDRLAMEDAYLGFDERLHSTYRKVAMDNHPDRNPGDDAAEQRFKESAAAYARIVDLSDAARVRLAHDLVYGDTTAWSTETLDVLHDVTAMFAPVFAQEAPPPPGDPCAECKGRGIIQKQAVNDFIPVAHVCESCRGNGTVPAFVRQFRSALEERVARAPAKKRKRKP